MTRLSHHRRYVPIYPQSNCSIGVVWNRPAAFALPILPRGAGVKIHFGWIAEKPGHGLGSYGVATFCHFAFSTNTAVSKAPSNAPAKESSRANVPVSQNPDVANMSRAKSAPGPCQRFLAKNNEKFSRHMLDPFWAVTRIKDDNFDRSPADIANWRVWAGR